MILFLHQCIDQPNPLHLVKPLPYGGRTSLVASLISYRFHCLPQHSWDKSEHQLNELILTSVYHLTKLSCRPLP